MAPNALGHVDYADRYAIELPRPMDAPSFCALILEAAPGWLDLLLSVRDSVAGRLGFNTQERNYGTAVRLAPGGKFGPLVVQSVSPHRVVCGDIDKHLTFRATFETHPVRPRGSFTTEVQFNDAVGRAYFALVKPFHKRIIPALVSGRVARVPNRYRGPNDLRPPTTPADLSPDLVLQGDPRAGSGASDAIEAEHRCDNRAAAPAALEQRAPRL